jgi:hypothetical protein
MKDNINNVKSMVCSQGIPEFNVPPTEPIIIDKIVIYDTKNLKLSLTDIKTRGFCDLDVISVNVSTDKLHFEYDIMLKRIILDAVYDVDIQILQVQLAHKGLIHVTLGT